MCRIEINKKELSTYITAGLPDMEGTKAWIKAQAEAGADCVGLNIPFSDPVADDPKQQEESYQSILKGTNLKKVFQLMEEMRGEKVEISVVFRLYYNTVLRFGVEAFAKKCKEIGVTGLTIPDLPTVEQEELQTALDKEI
ncbi:MAG: tryptophan synthase subunit alpha [Lachnospiraceae bacterium]|nr:tryptophan synthase subunit alpha [Lachnospiraceae bacterium]